MALVPLPEEPSLGSERGRGEHVCNPVGLSAERPGLSSLIDRNGNALSEAGDTIG